MKIFEIKIMTGGLLNVTVAIYQKECADVDAAITEARRSIENLKSDYHEQLFYQVFEILQVVETT